MCLRLSAVGVVISCLLAETTAFAQQPTAKEQEALDAIKALGGHYYSLREDLPVVWVSLARPHPEEPKPPPGFGRDKPVKDADLKELKELKSLELFDLSHTHITDAGLKELKELTNLRRLYLDGTQITNAGLKELKALPNLKGLGLSRTKITDAGLQEIMELKGLEELHLSETQVTDAGLAHLKGLKNVRSLDLSGTKISDAGLNYLKELKSLSEVFFHGTNVSQAAEGGFFRSRLPQFQREYPLITGLQPMKLTAGDDELRKLLKARYNTGVEELQVTLDLYAVGRTTPADILSGARNLTWWRNELGEKPEDLLPVLEECVKLAGEVERYTWVEYASASPRFGIPSVHSARQTRLDAEILLVRTKQKVKPPVK